MKRYILIFTSLLLCSVIACKQEKYEFKSLSEYGQFAPADAYEEDAQYAYYGSENEWNRRMFSENATSKYYKRQGQRQLLEILDGNIDSAIAICKHTLTVQPHDLESHFNLPVAFGQKGLIDSATYYMQKALHYGLPLSRYLAGPRDLLQPLYDSEKFQALQAQTNLKLIHGPMLGAVTTTSAKIWLRTAEVTHVDIKLVAENDSPKVFSGQSSAEDDFVLIIHLADLQPATTYSYHILIDGEKVAGPYHFRTYAKSYLNDTVTIGFGGGAGYTHQHERMWDTLALYRFDAFLFLGDNVYIDLPEMPGPFHDYTYYRRQSRPEYRHFLESTAIYAIWDDHDAAFDDVWMGPYLDKPAWKEPMLRHFQRQWVNPFYGLDDNPACYFNFSIGEVEFFMLDYRFYRTNPFKAERTMLGPVQKRWLKEKLLQSASLIKVIVSSVPWTGEAKPDSKDTWAGFLDERDELFSFLTANAIQGVILMSADRHRSDVWKIERENDYPLYELMSSRLTNVHTHPIMPGSLIAYNEKCSFGKLDFNFKDSQIHFSIVNIDNEVKGTLNIDFREIGVKY